MRLRAGFLGFLCCGALLCLTSASASRADTITVTPTQSIPLTQTNWGPFTPAGTNPMTFAKFDPSLGTLTGVEITGHYGFTDDISMKFDSPAQITVTSDQKTLSILRPDGTTIATGTAPVDTQVKLYGFNPGETVPQSFTYPTQTYTNALPAVTLTSASDLALFTGATASDTINIAATATAHSSISVSSANGSGGVITKAGADVSITYIYTPASVPEPTSLALFGFGMAGALLVRRRRCDAAR
jgi:hypothetical protein